MNWLPDREKDGSINPCAFISEDGRWSITRAPQSGYPCVYSLHLLGKSATVPAVHRRVSNNTERAAVMDELTAIAEKPDE